jgi:hypothetical protein
LTTAFGAACFGWGLASERGAFFAAAGLWAAFFGLAFTGLFTAFRGFFEGI